MHRHLIPARSKHRLNYYCLKRISESKKKKKKREKKERKKREKRKKKRFQIRDHMNGNRFDELASLSSGLYVQGVYLNFGMLKHQRGQETQLTNTQYT